MRSLPLLRRRFLLATLATTPWGLGGCQPAMPLRLAGHPWPGYEPMFLARTMGYLPTQVELRDTPTILDTLHALRTGQVDGVMVTLDEALLLRDQGIHVVTVLVFDISKGADVLLARAPIASASALRGRRIGAEDSALGSLMLAMVLDRAGLTRDQVEVVRIPIDRQEAAWADGSIDALITYDPVAARLRKTGARLLMSTRQMPETIIDVLAVRADALATHGNAVRAALAGHFRGLTYLRQNPWDAAYRIAPRLGLTAEEMIASLRGMELPDLIGNQRYLAAQNGELQRIGRRLADYMLQAGLIARRAELRGFYSGDYLPASTT